MQRWIPREDEAISYRQNLQISKFLHFLVPKSSESQSTKSSNVRTTNHSLHRFSISLIFFLFLFTDRNIIESYRMSTGYLEQLTISKGGNWCVIGDNCNEIKWSEKVVETIFMKSCKNKSYFRIILIALDYKLMNGAIQSFIESNGNSFDIIVFQEWSEFMKESETLLSYDPEHKNSMQGIFLLSLSELILTHGVKSLRSDITKITSKVHESTFEQHKFNTTLFVAAVHSSLHQVNSINHISSMFHSTITVIPNNSSLISSSVAAELKILRKAAGTTKITEQQELMQWCAGCTLDHIATDTSKKLPDSDISANNPAFLEGGTKHTVKKLNSRLITFDSTDPEFDEDSDPDADLDL